MRLIDAEKLKEKTFSYNFKNLIDDAPTVEAEPIRHGHWIHIDEGKITDCSNAPVLWKCSYCHTPFFALVDRYHYCPNCGALMDEVGE